MNGFFNAKDKQLRDLASQKGQQHRSKYVIILVDEMHVKEGLVYSKATGALVVYYNIGNALVVYCDIGELNNKFAEYERLVSE